LLVLNLHHSVRRIRAKIHDDLGYPKIATEKALAILLLLEVLLLGYKERYENFTTVAVLFLPHDAMQNEEFILY